MTARCPVRVLATYGPLAVSFVVAIAGVFDVLRRIRADAYRLGEVAGTTVGREAVNMFASRAESRWLTALGCTLVFIVLVEIARALVQRAASRRIQALAEFAQELAQPERRMQPAPPPFRKDDFAVLQQRLEALGAEIQRREDLLRAEAERQQMDAQIQRALTDADTEQEAYDTARRVLYTLTHEHEGTTATLLVADSSGAHLRQVLSVPEGLRACNVETPSQCLAVRRGHTASFSSPRALDTCPKLAASGGDGCGTTCMPITVAGRSVGVLTIASPEERPIKGSKLLGLESLACHLGVRMANVRALETSQVQAETDPLTGVLNRRTFEARAHGALTSGGLLTIALCDLDHFKKINDTRGHEMGDRALRRFAATLRRALRSEDVVARYGGEEFVVMLPGCDAEGAVIVMNRMRELLASTLERGDVPAFTVSVGIAVVHEHGATIEELVCAADAALYEAKRNGRDRVEIARSERASKPRLTLSPAAE